MALGFVLTTEQEQHILSADSVSPWAAMPKNANNASKVDDRLINSYDLQEESASTTSGDEDYSSVSAVSPRSSFSDESTTCMYSVMFLLQLRAARACTSGSRNALGYATEPVPEDARACTSSAASRPATKYQKSAKTSSKRGSKARVVAPASDRRPKTPLPLSAADSWVAQQRAKSADADEDARVVRAARSILNKLTIEKFESLFHQLVACGIKSPTHISTLMSEIFEKATSQHQFIPMYAELCVRLEKDARILSAVRRAGPLHSFRRLLLNQCQSVFEQLLEPSPTEVDVDQETQMCRKQKALGNIKLIGELLVQGMLSSDLFLECANELLQSRVTCREALESLAALVTVSGPKFDNKEWQHHPRFETLLSHMEELTSDKSTPARLRFLIRDVLDARKAGWTISVNQAAMKAAPMKLDDVREKVERETGTSLRPGQAKCNSTRLSNLTKICRAPPVGSGMRSTDDARARRQRPVGAGELPGKSPISRLADIVSKKVSDKKYGVAKTAPQEEAVTCRSESSCGLPIASQASEEFDLVTFRKALAATLAKLAQDKNVPAAVQYIRLQQVPVEYQADQFVDIVSRIVEERRGAVRRCELAFAASLVGAEQSAFDRQAGMAGIALFFEDVYADLCTEVPRLPAIMKSEFVPTMYTVFPNGELDDIVPEDLRTELV